MQKHFKLVILGVVLASFFMIPWIFRTSFEYADLTEVPGTSVKISIGSGYNAFPKVIRTDNTAITSLGAILAVWYNGDGHVDSNDNGRIMGAFSHDEGKNWLAPFVIYDDARWDCRNIGIAKAPNGTLTIFFAKVDGYQKDGPHAHKWMDFGYIRSTNHGITWGDFISLKNSTEFENAGFYSGNGYGDPVILNNTIYILCYGYPNDSHPETHANFLVTSTDNGTTWRVNSTLGFDTGLNMSEADFWYSEGKIFGFSRVEGDNGNLRYFESIPQSVNSTIVVNGTYVWNGSEWINNSAAINYTLSIQWSQPIDTGIWGQSPDIFRLTNGKHLVTYRAKGQYNYFVGFSILPASMASINVTETFFSDITTKCLIKTSFNQPRADFAYTSVISIGNQKILVVYYDIKAGGVFARTIAENDLLAT
jgi:hypothetical protein